LGGSIRQGSLDRILSAVEGGHLTQQLHRLELIDRTCIGLVAGSHRITGETEKVVDAKGMGSEQIPLQSDAVAIPASQLEHRFQACLQQQPAHGKAAHPHHRPASIGDIHSMHPPFQAIRHGQRVRGIATAGWHHLSGDRQIPCLERALQRRRQTLIRFRAPLCRIRFFDGPNMAETGDRTMSSADATDPLKIALSGREIEIIELVAEGLTNQEIADRLTISKRTVDNHVSNVFTKTGSKNRVALLNWAMDNGKICRDGFNCCALPDAESLGS
jgi:DNA-binding CsgD family transcriptional regulator